MERMETEEVFKIEGEGEERELSEKEEKRNRLRGVCL